VLLVKEELIQALARVIREVRPHLVITHYPFENGGLADQHAVTGQLAIHALNAAGSVSPGDPHPPHRVAQVFFMGIPPGMFRPTCLAEHRAYCDVYVDISDVIERKVQALDQLRSQQYAGAYARKRCEAADGNAGLFMGVAYAEGFITYKPELHYHLPVSDFLLERASESEAASHARTDRLLAHQVPL
jgi:LmbE family N-acetylglucosaminyl deacetylase